jgi:hypothetical protein
MKHDVHRPPHEYRGVVPYLLQRGCTAEGHLRRCGDTTHHFVLGTLGSACQAPGLGFVIWYCSKSEVFGDWSSLVCVGAEWPDNGRYFSPMLPALTNWPSRGPRVDLKSRRRATFTRRAPRHRYQVVFTR